jgi:DUF971 family protein
VDEVLPTAIEVRREEGVSLTFPDGHVATFGLEQLRLACPCATCRTLRDQGQASWPRPSSPQPLTITHAELHGAWGLSITWNDGHATGIYPFEALRRWSGGDQPFGPDSGLS